MQMTFLPLLLHFLLPTTSSQTDVGKGVRTGPADPDCSTPNTPHHGDWFCVQKDSDSLGCSLECDAGYVPSHRSVTSCSSNKWTVSPTVMTCEAPVVLLVGGNRVEVFGLGGLHKSLPDLPDLREGHTVDYVDSYVVLCGGVDDGSLYYNTGQSCMQLTQSNTWTPISNMNTKREQHSSVSVMDALIVMGGGWSTISQEVNFSTRAWSEWMVMQDLAEDSHRSCAVKVSATEYVVLGGSMHDAPLSTVVKYNAMTGLSNKLPNLPTPIVNPGCARINSPASGQDVIVAAGGENGETFTFQMETQTWREVGKMIIWKNGNGVTRLVALEGHLLAFISGSKVVQEFDFGTETWNINTESILHGREMFSATTVPSNYFV